MNAKQALRDHIEQLSQEEAAELLAQIEWDATEFESLTEDELREFRACEEEFARGEYSDGEDVFHRLGL